MLQRLAALRDLKGSETFYILFLDTAQWLLEVPAEVFRGCLGGSVRLLSQSQRRISLKDVRD